MRILEWAGREITVASTAAVRLLVCAAQGSGLLGGYFVLNRCIRERAERGYFGNRDPSSDQSTAVEC